MRVTSLMLVLTVTAFYPLCSSCPDATSRHPLPGALAPDFHDECAGAVPGFVPGRLVLDAHSRCETPGLAQLAVERELRAGAVAIG